MSHFDRFDIIESQYYVLNKYPHLFPSSVHKRFAVFCINWKFKPGVFVMSPGKDREGMRFNASQILRSVRNENYRIKNG